MIAGGTVKGGEERLSSVCRIAWSKRVVFPREQVGKGESEEGNGVNESSPVFELNG